MAATSQVILVKQDNLRENQVTQKIALFDEDGKPVSLSGGGNGKASKATTDKLAELEERIAKLEK